MPSFLYWYDLKGNAKCLVMERVITENQNVVFEFLRLRGRTELGPQILRFVA